MAEPLPNAPRHVVVLAHPNPHSFNALVASTYCETVREAGQIAVLRDLYAMNFDPILKDSERPSDRGTVISEDVEAELAIIRGAEIFVMVFPIWFGMPPAMMKGYIDRVLGAGVTASQIQKRSGGSPLRDRRLVTITSSGTSEIWLDEQAQIRSLQNVLNRYLRHAFGLAHSDTLHLGHIAEGHSAYFTQQDMSQVQDMAHHMSEAAATDHSSLVQCG